MKPRNEKRYYALLLTLCAASLTGCAATSTPSVVSLPAPPVMPQLSEPLPSRSYLDSARDDIQTWRKKLNATPTM